jgi:glycosyltransferase involved in cell wall biosynthesis
VQIGDDLAHAYAAADVLVLASRTETYGMVVTEALARGLPVIATAVGGLPEALGQASDGRRPGLLVPPEDSFALAVRLGCAHRSDRADSRPDRGVMTRRCRTSGNCGWS